MYKNALITGANRGLGLEMVRQLSVDGWCVYAACRSKPTDESDLKKISLNGGKIIIGIDVSSEEGVELLVKEVEGLKIHLLINNAGILGKDNLSDYTPDSIRKQFEVNALSPLIITSALEKKNILECGSKVVMLSSVGASIASQVGDAPGGLYGYRMSKCMLNMMSVILAKDLKPKGIAILIIHPGNVDTDMLDELIDIWKVGTLQNTISTAVSVEGILKRVELTTLDTSGFFYALDGSIMPW